MGMDEFSLDDNKKIDDFFSALDDVGLTEAEWDNFGVLWRKFGAKCPGQSEDFPNLTILNKAKKGREKSKLDRKIEKISTTLRKRDQFISVDDLPYFLHAINDEMIFSKAVLSNRDINDILNMEWIPTMVFGQCCENNPKTTVYLNDDKMILQGIIKVHRYDISKAIFTKLMALNNVKGPHKLWLFEVFDRYMLETRFPTREGLHEECSIPVKVYFANKALEKIRRDARMQATAGNTLI